MDIIDYMRFVPLFVDIHHIMICKKYNKKNIRQRIRPFYVLINVDGHTIFVELEGNFFNDLTSFNTNARYCNEDVLINLNVLDAWYSGIDNIMYVANCVDIC
jgi:hypothetical protein